MNKNQKIKILQDLIRIKSDNAHEAKVAKYIKDLFEKHQIKSKLVSFDDDRANLVAEIGQGKDSRILGFSGHMDTVAVSDTSEWDYDPYEAIIEGDRIYGRGAADMKSGLAAEVITLIELKEEGKLPAGKIRLLATFAEESGAPGAEMLTDQGYSKDLSAMVITEPTNGKVIYAHSGFLNYAVKSYGVAAHSSNPIKGVNAINNLIPFLNAETKFFENIPTDPLLGDVPHSVTIIKGGEQINTIPHFAELRGNIRPTNAFSNKEVIDVLRQTIEKINQLPNHQLELTIINDLMPVETDPNSNFIQFIKKMTEIGFENSDVKLEFIKGGTDASLFLKGNPTLPVAIMGADNTDISHQKNEYTTISSYLHLIEALKLIGTNYFTDL